MKFSSQLLAILSSSLGLSLLGCHSDIDDNEYPLCMYGTPYAEYEVKGVVTDSEDIPLEGINVEVAWIEGKFAYPGPTNKISTDKDGKFGFAFNHPRIAKLYLRFSDESGSYDEIREYGGIKFINETKKDDAWYNGKAEINIDVKLNKIKKDE